MGIVFAMYGCMMYALGYGRYGELRMVMECCGSYWGLYMAMLNYYGKLINEIN